MTHLSTDIETFSSVDIKKAGLYKYVQSPDFQIMLFAYSFDGTPAQVLDLMQGEQLPYEVLEALPDPAILKHAYNAPFEWYCLSKHLGYPVPEYWLPQWRCTMMHALYCGYTAGLAATGEALGLPTDKRKLGTGMSLIRTFCVPCKPTKNNGNRTRTFPHHEPERWNLFKEYCRQDVVTEMEIEHKLAPYPVPEQEQRLWELDQRINARGVRVDRELIDGALHCSETITGELMGEAVSLSGLGNPKSVKQLSEWLVDEGEQVENLQKATVLELIKTTDNDKTRRMLEIRQELSKTSVRKYAAMHEAVGEDGRVRGLLQFYGANRTGRWAGRLVQVQNLPRNYLETLNLARDCVKHRKLDHVRVIYGNVPDTLSQLIRTAFVPEDGHVFAVADFSAIEARVIAWLAGEQWRQEVFATHGKIYEASASAMFGVPIELISKGNPEYALRQKGKIAELALGYQGASGALITMGALNMGLTEEELPEIVRRWRSANKRIVDLWYAMENAALEVMRTGCPVGIKGMIIDQVGDYNTGTHFLTIQLPGSRKLYYAQPFLCVNEKNREALHYRGMNQTTRKWETVSAYGGKLVENVVQAIARDCLAESLVRLENAGYRTVMHIHDEAVLEVVSNQAEQELEKVCNIMGQPISWAPGLLLKADGFITDFYKKE
jgi:DNA polymerase